MKLKNTIEGKEFYVSKEFIEQIQKGSHESWINQVMEVANRNVESICGGGPLQLVGTFKNHAIVADEASNLYRLHLENSEKGLSLKMVEEVEGVARLTHEDLLKKLESEADDDLTQAIANPEEGCETKLKESFARLFKYKTKGMVEGLVSFQTSKENR